jgi:preprotein translocase subunit SecY
VKKFIQTIKNIWSIEELRNKIVFTLLLVFIYRIGSYIVIPGVDPNKLANLSASTQKGMLGLLDAFVGGAFSKASIFALGIMPYSCNWLPSWYHKWQKFKKKGRVVERK